MKVARLLPVVAIVGVIITACGGGNNTTTTTATVPSDLSISSFDASFSYMAKLKDLTAAGKGKVAVLLPDTTSSVRYVQFDEPYLRRHSKVRATSLLTSPSPTPRARRPRSWRRPRPPSPTARRS